MHIKAKDKYKSTKCPQVTLGFNARFSRAKLMGDLN